MSNRRRRPRRNCPTPAAEETLRAGTFVEAAALAMYMPEVVGGCNELFAFVAANGRVLRMVVDPGGPGSMRIWTPRVRTVECGDERVLYVAVRPKVEIAPPDEDAVTMFEDAKRVLARLGRTLLDVMLTDGNNVQSLSLALDPNSHWLDDEHDASA